MNFPPQVQPFDSPRPLHLRVPDPGALLHPAADPAHPEQLQLQRHDAAGREELGEEQAGNMVTVIVIQTGLLDNEFFIRL